MCVSIIINNGEVEIQTPRQFKTHFGFMPIIYGDSISEEEKVFVSSYLNGSSGSMQRLPKKPSNLPIKLCHLNLSKTFRWWLTVNNNMPENNITFCFNNCKFLNITESEQDKLKSGEQHYCERYNKKLLHKGYHPNLPILEECDYDNSEMRKNIINSNIPNEITHGTF